MYEDRGCIFFPGCLHMDVNSKQCFLNTYNQRTNHHCQQSNNGNSDRIIVNNAVKWVKQNCICVDVYESHSRINIIHIGSRNVQQRNKKHANIVMLEQTVILYRNLLHLSNYQKNYLALLKNESFPLNSQPNEIHSKCQFDKFKAWNCLMKCYSMEWSDRVKLMKADDIRDALVYRCECETGKTMTIYILKWENFTWFSNERKFDIFVRFQIKLYSECVRMAEHIKVQALVFMSLMSLWSYFIQNEAMRKSNVKISYQIWVK